MSVVTLNVVFLGGSEGFLLQVRGTFLLGVPVSGAVIVENCNFKSNELNLKSTELNFI